MTRACQYPVSCASGRFLQKGLRRVGVGFCKVKHRQIVLQIVLQCLNWAKELNRFFSGIKTVICMAHYCFDDVIVFVYMCVYMFFVLYVFPYCNVLVFPLYHYFHFTVFVAHSWSAAARKLVSRLRCTQGALPGPHCQPACKYKIHCKRNTNTKQNT